MKITEREAKLLLDVLDEWTETSADDDRNTQVERFIVKLAKQRLDTAV